MGWGAVQRRNNELAHALGERDNWKKEAELLRADNERAQEAEAALERLQQAYDAFVSSTAHTDFLITGLQEERDSLRAQLAEAKAGEAIQSGLLWQAYQEKADKKFTLSGWLGWLVTENVRLEALVAELSKPVTELTRWKPCTNGKDVGMEIAKDGSWVLLEHVIRSRQPKASQPEDRQ